MYRKKICRLYNEIGLTSQKMMERLKIIKKKLDNEFFIRVLSFVPFEIGEMRKYVKMQKLCDKKTNKIE